jgi:hypothetical protein
VAGGNLARTPALAKRLLEHDKRLPPTAGTNPAAGAGAAGAGGAGNDENDDDDSSERYALQPGLWAALSTDLAQVVSLYYSLHRALEVL